MLKQKIIIGTAVLVCVGILGLGGCKNETAEDIKQDAAEVVQDIQENAEKLADDTQRLAALGRNYVEATADKTAEEVKALKEDLASAAGEAKAKAADFAAMTETQVIELADTGNAAAQYYVGTLYAEGKRGFEQSTERAAEYFKKSADNGYYPAQYTLAELYHSGSAAVKKDLQQSAAYMTKAADQGYGLAQLALGKMYYAGEGLTKDFTAAFNWLKKAAEQGYGEAQLLVGRMYAKGEGVAQDYEKAAMYYTMASKNGVPEADKELDDIRLNLTWEQLEQAGKDAMEWLENLPSKL